MPLCQLLRKAAIDMGLSEVELCDHALRPRMEQAGFFVEFLVCFRMLFDFCVGELPWR